MRICSTGFARIDLLHLSKLVELMGATYDEYLTPKASVLICNDPQSASHDKIRHTTEWGIPAVSADWFWISIQSGQKKPIEPYIVRRQTTQGNSSMSKPASKEQSRYHTEKGRDGSSRGSTGSSHKERIDKPVSARNSNTRIMPIIGDGFSKEDDPFEPPKTIRTRITVSLTGKCTRKPAIGRPYLKSTSTRRGNSSRSPVRTRYSSQRPSPTSPSRQNTKAKREHTHQRRRQLPTAKKTQAPPRPRIIPPFKTRSHEPLSRQLNRHTQR
jgi:BRCA1 C Terminus (BRCT) domain.